MEEQKREKALDAWIEEYRQFSSVPYGNLPDIELYMDQLVGYLHKMLRLQEKSDDAPLLTASMVNNYVKDGYIARPEKKRYTCEHLATLYMLCAAKRELSVPEASALLAMLREFSSLDALYSTFIARQREIAKELSVPLTGESLPGDEALLMLALEYTLRACGERLVAERILSHLAEKKQAEREEAEKTRKAHEDAEKAAKKSEKDMSNKEKSDKERSADTKKTEQDKDL